MLYIYCGGQVLQTLSLSRGFNVYIFIIIFLLRLFLLVQLFGGVRAAEFSSRLSPAERKTTLKEFEQGKIQLWVSTLHFVSFTNCKTCFVCGVKVAAMWCQSDAFWALLTFNFKGPDVPFLIFLRVLRLSRYLTTTAIRLSVISMYTGETVAVCTRRGQIV